MCCKKMNRGAHYVHVNNMLNTAKVTPRRGALEPRKRQPREVSNRIAVQ